MELDDSEDEDRGSMAPSHLRSISISVTSTKGKVKAKAEPEEEEEGLPTQPRPAKRQRARTTKKRKVDEDKMDVDLPLPTPVHPSHKLLGRKSTTPPSPTKSRSKRKSIAPATPKPKSTPLQRSLLSVSFTPGSIDAKPPSPQRSESPTRKNRVQVEILTATGRKGLSTKGSMGSLKRTSAGSLNIDPNTKSRAGNKSKTLGEIVDTSLDGEVDWT